MDNINKPLQIKDKKLIHDDDAILTSKQIEALLEKTLGHNNIIKKDGQYLVKKRKIALLAKCCTWINKDSKRNDYRVERRRVQLSKHFPKYVLKNYENGFTTYYLGIYCYESEKDFLYILFDTTQYAKNKSNNSAAQVTIYDLISAKTRGQFFKYDKMGNRIYILNKTNFVDFILNSESSVLKNAELEYELLLYLKSFWNTLPLVLKGEDCYEEMYNNHYSNTFQSEWVGFYHEFSFQRYLSIYPTNLVEVYADKSINGIDLDLKINVSENFYGDLKSDNENFDIQGNKKSTIDRIISTQGHIWYIVATFNNVIMDNDMNYCVMNKYNKLKVEYNNNPKNKDKKRISMDYSDKMKYSAIFDHFYVLDINFGNIKYLSDYKQGKNSDGSKRTLKYKINKKTINEFKIFEFKK